MNFGVQEGLSYENNWDDKQRSMHGVTLIDEMGSRINIIGVYNRIGISKLKKTLEEKCEPARQEKHLVLGDWNARIGLMGARNSMDSRIDKEGEVLVNFMEENGFEILNGKTEGDWNGRIIHTDYRSESVIDYAAANAYMIPIIQKFVVGEQTQSDHFPIEAHIRDFNQQTYYLEEARTQQNFK